MLAPVAVAVEGDFQEAWASGPIGRFDRSARRVVIGIKDAPRLRLQYRPIRRSASHSFARLVCFAACCRGLVDARSRAVSWTDAALGKRFRELPKDDVVSMGGVSGPAGQPPWRTRPWQCLYFLPEPQGRAALRACPSWRGHWGSRARLAFGRPVRGGDAAAVGSAGSNRVVAHRGSQGGSSWTSCICAVGMHPGIGGCSMRSCRVESATTCSRRPLSMSLNRLNASRLYSFSGSSGRRP